MRYSRHHSRRGVLLLVVLALLAMFGMVAVTFVVVASQARMAAEVHQRLDEVSDPFEESAHSALMQVLRGINDPNSVIGPHSLLEDVYGNSWVAGSADRFQYLDGRWDLQYVLIRLVADDTYLPEPADRARRVGSVLTMVDGPAAGFSTRIVNYNAADNEFHVLPFPGQTIDEDSGDVYFNQQPLAGQYVISGTPFSGTGFGWDDASGTMTDLALLPGAGPGAVIEQALQTGYPCVGANEDYDAPDFQNMLLAAQLTDANGRVVGTIPSLHRPALVNYWYNVKVQELMADHSLSEKDAWLAVLQPWGPDGQPGTADDLADEETGWEIANFTRQFLLRPLTEYHPDFDGSNPYSYPNDLDGMDLAELSTQYWQAVGPWDVDNDGDGIPDSIWVDLGFPARSSADGQLYKPLVAILCVDLDGRLNLNAHGSLAQVNEDPWGGVDNYYNLPTPNTGQQFASGTRLLRGQGYGPAEINLSALFSTSLGYSDHYRRLLLGAGGGFPGRYGDSQVPGAAGIDLLGSFRWFNYNYQQGYWSDDAGAYGTPPDMQSALPVGLDLAGRPIWDPDFCGQRGADNPYESDPLHRFWRGTLAMHDAGFSTAELERVLRYFDPDATALPRRLLELTSGELGRRRHEITTDSVDVPVPGGGVDPVSGRSANGFLALLHARINDPTLGPAYTGLRLIDPETNKPVTDADGDYVVGVEVVEFLFGPELVAGRKLNLDRPLPDGDLVARQELARNLFCLAMLLRDPGYRFPWPTTDSGVPGNEEFLTARHIAQWAVNAVDFVDSDSIMTPFEFDAKPFTSQSQSGNDWHDVGGVEGNPWDVDGDLTTDEYEETRALGPDHQIVRAVVWGTERPNLLLTETLAFHDRRVADTGHDNGTQKERTEAKDPEPASGPEPADEDLDQPRVPQGSLFVELYCTTEPGADKSTDLYTNDGLLDLGKRIGNAPVWRLAISKNARTNSDNDLEARFQEAPVTFVPETDYGTTLVPGATASDLEIERVVSFLNVNTPTHTSTPATLYYNYGGADVRLAPGEYLLVGPRTTTAIGSTMEQPPKPSPQVIMLDPGSENPVDIPADLLGGREYPAAGSQINSPKAMIAGARKPAEWGVFIDLSVSEPLPNQYYPDPTETHDGVKDWYGDPNMGDITKLYLDTPLDSRSGMPLAETWVDENTGRTLPGTATRTTPAFRYVLLQRLADPTQRYHAVTNPYRTIDWMPIDLTVFNGQDRQPNPWPPLDAEGNELFPWEAWDPDDPTPDASSPPNSVSDFQTQQRGSATGHNLWAQQFSLTPADYQYEAPTTSAEPYFQHPLNYSLGFLNVAFGNATNPPGLTSPAGHIGDPTSPFPWLTWNNRPPASPLELMMVPATTAARLGWEYTMASSGGPRNPYTPANGDRHPHNSEDVGFAHLMNFFNSGGGASFHCMFDFLTVPSRFAGAQLYVPERDPPQHLVPTYREPGKINLNTVFSERVFRGLMNGFREGDANFWRKFVASRRGYGSSDNLMEFDSANWPPIPTRFARPFRSAAADKLWPDDDLWLPDDPPRPNSDRRIEATLMRSDPDNSNVPLFAFDSNDDINNTDRNPYFRYQGLMRLGNLVTTRSNVYAVWITIGHFEATPNANVPGGYQLGRELGIDTGEIRRHRAFYVIDRSIPVGFVRGQDLNVEDTILLQRFIE